MPSAAASVVAERSGAAVNDAVGGSIRSSGEVPRVDQLVIDGGLPAHRFKPMEEGAE